LPASEMGVYLFLKLLRGWRKYFPFLAWFYHGNLPDRYHN
jgi:hypothetical protein